MSLKEEIVSENNTDSQDSYTESEAMELKILNKIGNGKVPVYLAFECIRKAFFAMKVFPFNSKEFHNEVRFIGLSHENICAPRFTNTEVLPLACADQIKVSYILSDYAPHKDFFDLLIDQAINFD
jgi:hypothetical protein